MPKRQLIDDLLGDSSPPTTDPLSPQPESKKVPNIQPRITNVKYKLAIIGEAPGEDEVSYGEPFVGHSGRELNNHLSRFGLIRDACFVGNICQHRPPKNEIAAFDWNGPQIREGLSTLSRDLQSFRPSLCLLLGGTALHAFKAPSITPKKKRTRQGKEINFYPYPIGRWRGSFFTSSMDSPLPGVKCVASYHPAACLRQHEWMPVLMLDIQRAKEEAMFPEWNPPLRQLKIGLSFPETVHELEKVIENKPLTSTDIEGGIGTMSCISFATAKDYAFIVPFSRMDGLSYWPLDRELVIWKLLNEILSNPNIPKILQNSLYDRFVLQYSYHIVVKGVIDDTLLKHWELYCEMRKSLAFLASIYTREPYWKEERIQAETDDVEPELT